MPSVKSRKRSVMADDDFEECCWLCLGTETDRGGLQRRCGCPRVSHAECLSMWQLHCAGRSEETNCSFCKQSLPDWRTPFNALPRAPPIMTVCHGGMQHLIQVRPGSAGREAFHEDVRRVCGLRPNDQLALTFGCKAPRTGHEVTLKGWESYEAAVVCASIAAGQRMAESRRVGPEEDVSSVSSDSTLTEPDTQDFTAAELEASDISGPSQLQAAAVPAVEMRREEVEGEPSLRACGGARPKPEPQRWLRALRRKRRDVHPHPTSD